LSSELIAWEEKMDAYHKWCLPFSFCRYKVMGMRPAMASMPSEGDMQKAPVI